MPGLNHHLEVIANQEILPTVKFVRMTSCNSDGGGLFVILVVQGYIIVLAAHEPMGNALDRI